MPAPIRTLPQARERLRSHQGDERFAHEMEEMQHEQDLGKIDDDVEVEATLIEWSAEEHAHRPKGAVWYVGVITVALLLGIAFWLLGNFLGIGVVILGAVLIFASTMRQPAILRYRLMVDGVAINDKLYHYKNLDAFNIIYEPGDVKVLLVRGRKTLSPLLALELGDVNPVQVRDILLEFLQEDQDISEPFADVLWRRLGF